MPVTLQDMLDARENRALKQEELLKKYQNTIISYTLNIAGPVKRFPYGDRCFHTGKSEIQKVISRNGCFVSDTVSADMETGLEFIWAVACDPVQLKIALADIEERHPLGRLFDIDVIGRDGNKISRDAIGLPERPCLICGKPGAGCARSRAHTAAEVFERTQAVIGGYLLKKDAAAVARNAVRALLYEVSATPKPGLVDRCNNGANSDMDFFTFIDSSAVLYEYFREMAETGAKHRNEPPGGLLRFLRSRGIEAEEEMFAATGGVNTHKGAIFSLGIICAALGWHGAPFPDTETALRTAAQIAAPSLERGLAAINTQNAQTHGETAFAMHGLQGVRKEAAAGFPSVERHGLPALRAAAGNGFSLNDAGVAALLNLIANAEDTNVVSRSSLKRLSEIQDELKKFISAFPGRDEILSRAARLDRRFIEENISPGGSADLLAITYMMYFIENCQYDF